MDSLSNNKWHALTLDRVFTQLDSNPQQGLNQAQVTLRLVQYGENSISTKKTISSFKRLILQFHNPLIYILLVATVVTFFLKEYVDSSVIFGVVIINALIGYLQEAKAEEAINSLKKMLSSTAKVLRDGKRLSIPATGLVPGDVVYLASGDKVPADLRLFENRDLQIDESALTGESVATQKNLAELAEDTALADRSNMAFAGTLVTYGQGNGVVIGTGDSTETGKIADMISNAISLDTPLTRKIHAFSKLLLWVILGLAALTFIVGIVIHGQDWVSTFMAAVALAVAAIPEGLPAVVTITLAIGVRRMASRHAIIRKLPAVETLGSTTIICSDKTGTLTENQMTVQTIICGGEQFGTTGGGYQPQGELLDAKGQTLPLEEQSKALRETLKAGLLCNDSQLVQIDGLWQIQGDPTEGALIVAALKAHLVPNELMQQYPRLDVIPFESDRQYMASLHRYDETQNVIYLKGSLEQTLKRCINALDREINTVALDCAAITKVAEQLAAQGLRVLALACKQLPANETSFTQFHAQEPHQNLSFVGLQAMIDPPRAEVITAVAKCQQAGIAVKMITGDHALTAQAIAGKIGIANPEAANQAHRALAGHELSNMDDTTLLEQIEQVAVFARVAPEQKLRLVTLLQQKQHVVAMTGDGVNDAPALKQADIGVAMGIAGTEVSKEAADMVLTNDNFATIEAAVEEGRTVFDNLLKFITWILPTNIGQGMVIMVAVLLGTVLPVLPVQALWLNMTTAIFLGLMLAFEPKEQGIMNRPPRTPNAPILSAEMLGRVISVSTLLLVGAFGLFEWALASGASEQEARTLAVTLFVVVQTFFLFNCRSLSISLFKTPMFSNPWIWLGVTAMLTAQLAFIYLPTMNTLFQSAPMSLRQWGILLAYGAFVLVLIELEKSFWRRRKQHCIKAEIF